MKLSGFDYRELSIMERALLFALFSAFLAGIPQETVRHLSYVFERG